MNPKLFCAVGLALFVAACADTATLQIQETRQPHAGVLLPGEAVTAVSLRSTIGGEVAACLARTIRESGNGIKVVPPRKFRNGLFPWFEPSTLPTTVGGLAKLMERPAVERRTSAFGVRYVVAVGDNISDDSDVWSGVGGVFGVGFVAAGVSFNESTRLVAVILDLNQARPVAEVSASASGEGAAGIVIPIPYYVAAPDTATITCEAIAKRVVAFLKGEPQAPDHKVRKEKPR